MARPKFFFYPYGPSNSVSDLVDQMDAKIILRERSRYKFQPGDTIINWGCSKLPKVLEGATRVLNRFDAVANATSKIETYKILDAQKVPCVFCFKKGERSNYNAKPPVYSETIIQELGKNNRIVGRDLDNGSQGRGITVYERGAKIGDHKFYTTYHRKQREFRVHVFQGQYLFAQEKLRKDGEKETADKYIRSHERGWVFAFHQLEKHPVPEDVKRVAIDGIAALGLDFGAVDIGWNTQEGARIFEINTAPGIENTSLKMYVEAFNNAR